MTWLIPLSQAEHASRTPSPATLRAARASLRINGCVLLRGVFSVEAIGRVAAEFEAQWGNRGESDMADAAKGVGAKPALRVGEKRYEVLLTLQNALADPMLFASPLLYPVLASELGGDMRI